jgi:hypothetical protein
VILMEWHVSEGQLDGFDPETLEHRATISKSADGWVLAVHGTAVNDAGDPYQWSRLERDAAGGIVVHATVGAARARAETLGPQVVAEYAAADRRANGDAGDAAHTDPA